MAMGWVEDAGASWIVAKLDQVYFAIACPISLGFKRRICGRMRQKIANWIGMK
jgi:hypothetical protein